MFRFLEARSAISIANDESKRPKIIILGALSAIAEAAAREWADKGASLMLAGRSGDKLDAVANDLRTRGADVKIHVADLANVDVEPAFADMIAQLGGVDVVLLAYGVLGDQAQAEQNARKAQQILRINFTSAAGWCLAAANVLEEQNHGSLVVIGSVAGDRGRMSNYIYGASKGGLGILVQGIAHRLAKSGASAVLIKPGFVDTPMTASFKKTPLWAKPEAIARTIVRAASRRSRNPVLYTPWFWRPIMTVIRLMPSPIMHKTKL